jgi:hypothetical protein
MSPASGIRRLGSHVALLTGWFLCFATQRRFLFCQAALIIPYLVFTCSLGYMLFSRY